ncbi:MAG TPA: hypothetical protein VHL31_11605 [Geminicoccus sp.]|jgi:hypothetical protein|uniref:hypothetical protein n=1 Tax=Geminicoccus sp. TaxID=2024832 RepID=UPI002E36241E|nr:hypothetical protein [Geminicoccus sp.]HEX2526925.1 hypothetical protein [Geminicoccus sp.]
MTRTNQPDPDRLPDFTKVDAVQFVDALNEAWCRSVQLKLLLAGMVLPRRGTPSAELTKLEAAWALSEEAVYGLGQVKEALGASDKETTLD